MLARRVIRGVSQEPLPILFVSDNKLVPSKVLPLAKSNSSATQKLALRIVYVALGCFSLLSGFMWPC